MSEEQQKPPVAYTEGEKNILLRDGWILFEEDAIWTSKYGPPKTYTNTLAFKIADIKYFTTSFNGDVPKVTVVLVGSNGSFSFNGTAAAKFVELFKAVNLCLKM